MNATELAESFVWCEMVQSSLRELIQEGRYEEYSQYLFREDKSEYEFVRHYYALRNEVICVTTSYVGEGVNFCVWDQNTDCYGKLSMLS